MTPERDLWARLKQSSVQFSGEARRILAVDAPETFAPARWLGLIAFVGVIVWLYRWMLQRSAAAQAAR